MRSKHIGLMNWILNINKIWEPISRNFLFSPLFVCVSFLDLFRWAETFNFKTMASLSYFNTTQARLDISCN
jgi:hypothetical protein